MSARPGHDLGHKPACDPITPALLKRLHWLAERGGSGILDLHGRVVAGGEVSATATWASWLRLVALGHVAGEAGRLALTESGWRLLRERAREAEKAAAVVEPADIEASEPVGIEAAFDAAFAELGREVA